MKNILKYGIWALLSFVVMAACSPQEDEKYTLGTLDTVTADQITFTQTPSSKTPNEISFTNTTDIKGIYTMVWDLGNGGSGKDKTVTGKYPFAGDYTVKLTLYTPDGTSATKSQVIHIAQNDYSLISTPAYVNLTGGADDVDGKTWVFDQYNNFTKEVAAAGFAVSGHLGLGPQGSRGQSWWGAKANEKADWKMYDFKFTFIQAGVKLNIVNNGEGYGRKKSSASIGGFNVTGAKDDDVFFPYSGGNYTFSLIEGGQYPTITLSGNAFMGYYCGSQVYEIIYQTDKVMALRVDNTAEGQDWVFVYCREDLNVAPPPVVKNPKAIPLAENFEATPLVTFAQEDMGTTSGVVDNPLPLPINTSNKVYRYYKSTGFYSNLSYTAATYKFDLTKLNKVKVKVYIPSFNDYTTENSVAGSWISNTKLLHQLSVKLQDSSKGGDAWQTQTEIVKANLVENKWIELTFDFSSVADRKDYDKIVIQFGAEGHSGSGYFYFDDFSFSE
ncbi:MAG: domain containing protein (Precursor) [Bacteroidetes bacterium]|nr:domain containing protein (Precursor) [Bacteroidota bacterium]